MTEFEYDRPMTEAQWEALFRRSDAKAAKYEELLETLGDEPDGQLIIAREMGWKWLADARENDAQTGESHSNRASRMFASDQADAAADDEASDDAWLEDEFDDEDEDDETFEVLDREREQLNRIPAYCAARDLASRAGEVLRPLMETEVEAVDDDLGQLLGEAFIAGHQAAVKIAGGHAVGYDDDVLCGNIVNNRISLESIERCQQAWAELQQRRIVTPAVAEPLIAEMREVQRLIEERIAELRSRVWW